MKQIILASLLLLTAASCSKQDDRPKPSLPAPTCDDPSDDGKFEIWERAQLDSICDNGYLEAFSYRPRFQDSEIPGVVEQLKLVYQQGAPWLGFSFVAHERLELTARLFLPTGEIANYAVLGITPTKNGEAATCQLPMKWVNAPGTCSRLYYIFTDANARVVTKGHYDIAIN